MTLIRLIIIVFSIAWLSGCATINQPQQQVAQNKTISWGSRVQTLSGIQSWDLKGAIAIRQADNSGTASLQWKQQGQNYHIAMFGPLGSNSFELTGRPGNVELAQANGKRANARSPEELLAKETGWRLPVSSLYYWIRGIPVPGTSADKHLDSYNHLIELRQLGWIIQYPRYTSVRQIDIPDKIFLTNPQLNVKIAVSQWQF